jgi:hypothetical protein
MSQKLVAAVAAVVLSVGAVGLGVAASAAPHRAPHAITPSADVAVTRYLVSGRTVDHIGRTVDDVHVTAVRLVGGQPSGGEAAGSLTYGGVFELYVPNGRYRVSFEDPQGRYVKPSDRTVVVSDADTDLGDVTLLKPAAQALDAPAFSPAARPGTVLHATPGTWDLTALTYGYTWLVDGDRVGTGARYRVGVGDVGHQVRVVVSAERAGHERGSARSPAQEVVKWRPSLTARVVSTADGRAVVLTVLSASPVGAHGDVTLKVDGRAVRTGTLRSDSTQVRIFIPRLERGRHELRLVYAGDERVAGGSTSLDLVVR